ncbi:MAG: hypothetical protein HKL84_08260 [Acidimicrobiaceae bacterium]|nr:hypothetical protein [Acidimicrobiaceae bacterium]
MIEASGSDPLYEFELISQELVELMDAGLPKGRSRNDGDTPEGWDSKEIVAHMAESCEFWRLNLEEGLRRPGTTIVGRPKLDEERSSRISKLSRISTTGLIDRLTLEIGKTAGLLAALEPNDLGTALMHLADGQITVSEMISKHLVAHLDEHLVQLRELEELPPTI